MKRYSKGFCRAFVENDINQYAWLKELSDSCEEFILGIPDDWVTARLYGDGKVYSAEAAREYWIGSGWFKDVVILDAEHLDYKMMHRELNFDMCVYGTEYGLECERDKIYMRESGVDFISLAPEKRRATPNGGSLRLALNDLQRHQKIVLFGTGSYFNAYMKTYGACHAPAYAVDNNADKWGTKKASVRIKKLEEITREPPQDLLVVICAKNPQDMLLQLKSLGNYNYRTMLSFEPVSILDEFAITSREEREYLAKAQRILTNLMAEFDRVCMKYHLHYYVICGSLIGVVRHRNHIPWDDDIDVAMPRADFKKLQKIALKEWKNDTYMFLDYDELGGGAFLDCMPRLFYLREHIPSKCYDKVAGKAKADVVDRAFIDIYVMDNAHVNDKVNMLVTNIMKGIYNLMMGHRAYIDYNEYTDLVSDKMSRFMKVINKIGSFIPIKLLAFCYDALARSANLSSKSTDYIMDSCAIRCIELKYPKKHYGEGKRMPFGDIEVMVPSDYEAQLEAMRYHNYMQYPRMSVRKPSHYFNSDISIS